MIIYKLSNTKNKKIYIGQTIQKLDKRIGDHFSNLQRNNHKNTHLQNAYNKYGKKIFSIKIIDTANSLKELNKKEKYWINYYNSMSDKNGYNLTSGGDNRRWSNEVKLKLSKSKIGKNNPNFNKKASKNTRKKMSNAKIGKKHPMFGKTLSESHRNKISIATKGRIPWNKGKKLPNMSCKNAPMYGKTAWNKGKTGVYSKKTLLKMSKIGKINAAKRWNSYYEEKKE